MRSWMRWTTMMLLALGLAFATAACDDGSRGGGGEGEGAGDGGGEGEGEGEALTTTHEQATGKPKRLHWAIILLSHQIYRFAPEIRSRKASPYRYP